MKSEFFTCSCYFTIFMLSFNHFFCGFYEMLGENNGHENGRGSPPHPNRYSYVLFVTIVKDAMEINDTLDGKVIMKENIIVEE